MSSSSLFVLPVGQNASVTRPLLVGISCCIQTSVAQQILNRAYRKIEMRALKRLVVPCVLLTLCVEFTGCFLVNVRRCQRTDHCDVDCQTPPVAQLLNE